MTRDHSLMAKAFCAFVRPLNSRELYWNTD